MSASAVASRAPRSAVGSPARRAARHRPARPAPPLAPADFYSREARALLADLLATRAAAWQADSMQPLYFYGRDSEPLWGEYAGQRCSGTTLRIAGKRVLCEKPVHGPGARCAPADAALDARLPDG
jgi:hypothetical protein